MKFNIPTLLSATIVVMAVVALLLVWAWLHNRREKALLWWGLALLLEMSGTALVILRGNIPDWLSIVVANALLIAACGLIWGASRLFNGRSFHPNLGVGAATWFLACCLNEFYSSLSARASLLSLLVSVYALLAAWEFWRGQEPLVSRRAIVVCLTVHAIVFILHTPAVMFSSGIENTLLLAGPWFVFIAFQGIIQTILAAFLLMTMAKEREELRYKTASRVDPLTGAFNRRYFVASAERVIEKASRDGRAVALILFDLDHFKAINDSLGHQLGDEVLKLFCFTASMQLQSDDIFGRLGGEEFAVILPVGTAERALEVANRILTAFELQGRSVARPGLEITASAGLSMLEEGISSFDDLFTVADLALYKAKRMGRNRAEGAVLQPELLSTRETRLLRLQGADPLLLGQ